jgi:hypothetical protein
MIKRIAFVMTLAFGITVWAICLPAKSDGGPEYPTGYRKWAHVSSTLVGPQSPFFKKYGGLHHIYANDKAMEGYRTGHFPDGSVVVFDLLETREVSGSTLEGARRFIDMMAKDSEKYKATGGWGFEEFNGDSQTERALNEEAKTACYNCHSRQKDHDSVFSVYRK